MTNLYHFELGFPKGLKTDFGVINLTYTYHARKAAETDRYGYMELPVSLDTSEAKAIEVEVIDNAVTKIVYRIRYNSHLDMVLVVTNDARVKTVWFNKRNDKHKTLDTSRYTIPKAS